MSNEKSVMQGVQEVANHFGRIDYAVNNAGGGGPIRPSSEVSAAEFRAVIDLNMVGLWIGQREQIKQMLRQEPLKSLYKKPFTCDMRNLKY